jgi:hypothetical protein
VLRDDGKARSRQAEASEVVQQIQSALLLVTGGLVAWSVGVRGGVEVRPVLESWRSPSLLGREFEACVYQTVYCAIIAKIVFCNHLFIYITDH